MSSPEIVSAPLIESQILRIRGHQVLLDADLARLYQVTTGNLNLAVRRNRERFPEHFLFQLSPEEFQNLKLQTARSSWGGRRHAPYAFTEQGVAMLSSVLNSPRAIQVNIVIMRTFVRLRQFLADHEDLAVRLDELERQQLDQDVRIDSHAQDIEEIFDAIRSHAVTARRSQPPPDRLPGADGRKSTKAMKAPALQPFLLCLLCGAEGLCARLMPALPQLYSRQRPLFLRSQ